MPTRSLLTFLSARNAEKEQLPSGNVRKYSHFIRARQRFFLVFLASLSFFLGLTVYRYILIPTAERQPFPSSSIADTVEPDTSSSDSEEHELPPTFDRFHELERNYPQHDTSLPYPEGKNGRFLWISNQHWGLGFNNIFQALLLNAQMAYLLNRAYVFENYTWDVGTEQFVDYNGHLIPSRVPLAALISGPIAGGPFPPEHPSPRAVSRDWFLSVCPEKRRKTIQIKDLIADFRKSDSALHVMDDYVRKLADISEGCLELAGYMEHPFDFHHFEDPSMDTLWPSLSVSPVLTHFGWSPLALSALPANAAKIAPSLEADPLPDTIPELMAIHIRRGDYLYHCGALAKQGLRYFSWNQMKGLPDRFEPPIAEYNGHTVAPEIMDIYLSHCLPTIEHIVERIQQVDKEWRAGGRKPIMRLYIMTNGPLSWVTELKLRLEETGSWESVCTSREITYTHEQKYIAQNIDMAIGERAGLFLGNGFSSLSANVVLLRRAHGHPLESNRFWG